VINRVVLRSSKGSETLSLTQFLELPLNERIQLILARVATFYCDDVVVERQDAMRYLRSFRR
jgi:hypothetical protein